MDRPVETLEVDEATIKQTVVCHKQFACLKGQLPCCSIERYVGDSVFFIKNSSCDCLYKIPFGFSEGLCACPVRRELFRLYGK